MKEFSKIEGYPPELIGRLNSFIVTEFDDSMTVEMQLRVLIKWIIKNIDLTNEMVEYLNQFIKDFDGKLYETVKDILEKWLADGVFDDIIKDSLNDFNKRISEIETTLSVQMSNYLKFDGSDETQLLQETINTFAGKVLVFPNNKKIILSKTIFIPPFTDLYSNNFEFKGTNIAILNLGKYTSVKGFIFSGVNTGDIEEIGIEITGTLDCDAPTYVEKVTIENCIFKSFGGYGVRCEYGNTVDVLHCVFEDIGYSAVMGYSSNYMRVNHNKIDTVFGADPSLAYGIAFTHLTTKGLDVQPISTHCQANFNTIKNIPTWEGLDTHGGAFIDFIGNTIERCKVGIASVLSQISGTGVKAPENVVIKDNIIHGSGNGFGIAIGGIPNGEATSNIIIDGNSLYNCGIGGANIGGAIRVIDAKYVSIINNFLDESRENAIVLLNNVKNVLITSNLVKNPYSETFPGVSAISMRDNVENGNNDVFIDGNQFVLSKPTLAKYVGEKGVWTNGLSHSGRIGTNISSFKTKYDVNKNFLIVEENIFALHDFSIPDNHTYFTTQKGDLFMYKGVTIDATTTDPIEIPFPYQSPTPLSGVKVATVNINGTQLPDALTDITKLTVQTTTNSWILRMSEVGKTTTLSVTLFCLCYFRP